MNYNKGLIAGSLSLLILKLINQEDMYGYQITEKLSQMSNNSLSLKAGTLYPLLKSLEDQDAIESYEKIADNCRIRKYYCITTEGQKLLANKESEWDHFFRTVNSILRGGSVCATF